MPPIRVSLDFETRSRIDLRRVGVYRYARDESTEPLCMAWAVEDEEPQIWQRGEPFPPALVGVLRQRVYLCAWNAQFEREIWQQMAQRADWPAVDDRLWVCTAALAARANIPRRLDLAAHALHCPIQKDMAGHRLMLKCARPTTAGAWYEPTPAEWAQLLAYCQ